MDHGLSRHRQAEKDRKEGLSGKTGDKLVEQMAKALEQATLKATAQAILAPAPSVMAPAITPSAAPPQTNTPTSRPPVQYAARPVRQGDRNQIQCHRCERYGHYARSCRTIFPTDYPPPNTHNPNYEEQGIEYEQPRPREQGRGRANNRGGSGSQRGRSRGNGQDRGGWRPGNANMQGVSAGPEGSEEWYHYGDTY